jgi:hypothetical protein
MHFKDLVGGESYHLDIHPDELNEIIPELIKIKAYFDSFGDELGEIPDGTD